MGLSSRLTASALGLYLSGRAAGIIRHASSLIGQRTARTGSPAKASGRDIFGGYIGLVYMCQLNEEIAFSVHARKRVPNPSCTSLPSS